MNSRYQKNNANIKKKQNVKLVKRAFLASLLISIISISITYFTFEMPEYYKMLNLFESSSYQERIEKFVNNEKKKDRKNDLDFQKRLKQSCPETPRKIKNYDRNDLSQLTTKTVESYARAKKRNGDYLSYDERYLLDKHERCIEKFKRNNTIRKTFIYHPQLSDMEKFFGRNVTVNETSNYTNRLIFECKIIIGNNWNSILIYSIITFIISFIVIYVILFMKSNPLNYG